MPHTSLCAQILRVRYETPSEWRGLIKAQQETVRVGNYNPQVVWDAFKRGQEAGNKARLVVQVRSGILQHLHSARVYNLVSRSFNDVSGGLSVLSWL